MRTPALLLSCVACSSCVLGPQPGSPETPVPASIRGDSAPHGASFGNKAWRQVFTDSTLRSLIERALANNPDLVAATYRIEQARARANAARSEWFPRLDGSAGGSTDRSPAITGVGDRDSESYDIGGVLSWELDLWGGIRRSNEAARARLLEAEYQRDAVQTSLVAAVATAYIELRNLD
ncbi:MAG TPA: TolC family protein, partial [Luteolibacter sp.]|nr:TolC family protein [Luteolibacter sp.]